jgi:hypothetical protein
MDGSVFSAAERLAYDPLSSPAASPFHFPRFTSPSKLAVTFVVPA